MERLGGVTLLMGGVLAGIAHTIHPAPPQTPQALSSYMHATVTAHLILGFAILLVCMGLPFLCARLSQPGAVLPSLAYPLLFFGLMSAEFLHCPVEIALFPEFQSLGFDRASQIAGHIFSGESVYGRVQSLSLPVLVVGVLCLLLATRRHQLPRWPAFFLVAFFLFLAASFVPLPRGIPAGRLFAISLYVAFAGYGAAMLNARPAASISSADAEARTPGYEQA
jgi:hypothetical protein